MPAPRDGTPSPPRAPADQDRSAGSAGSAGSVSASPHRSGYGRLWRARLAMLRPGNCLMAALGALTGIAIVADPPGLGGSLAAAAWVAAPAAAFLVAAFGNVLNDLADHRLDARAHPERPLPAGLIGRREAKLTAGLFLALGLWEAYVAAGWPTLAFAGANALALAAYEARLKRAGLPGNVLVALLVASTFAFGALATGVPPTAWGLLWLLAAMAFLANVARELLKDVEDMAADSGERDTFPLRAGAGAARLLAFGLVNAAVLLSALAFLRPPPGWGLGWLAVLAGADLLFLVGAALAWLHVGQAQRVLKLAMLAALAAFLAGALLP